MFYLTYSAYIVHFVVIQSLVRVQLFATPWTIAHEASLSSTISWSLLKVISIESVMLFNHHNLHCPLLLLPSVLPTIRVFSNELVFVLGGQRIGTSASASVLPMNIQDFFPMGFFRQEYWSGLPFPPGESSQPRD